MRLAESGRLEGDVVVSVAMTTFNHAPFIRQALDSVLAQHVDGRCEIVIGEDCSTDGTRGIVEEYAVRYPGVIRPILPARNLGYGGNMLFERVLARCTGRYVAMLDGDDYWLSAGKLRCQVALLDARPELSGCFHNVLVLYDDARTHTHPIFGEGESRQFQRSLPPAESGVAELMADGNFIPTCAVLFRRGLAQLPAWYRTCPIGDWPIHVLNAEHGPFAYIDDVLAVYRVHAGGIWSSGMSHEDSIAGLQAQVQMYDLLDRHLAYAHHPVVAERLRPLLDRGARLLAASGDMEAAAAYARRYLRRRLPRSRRDLVHARIIVSAQLLSLRRLLRRVAALNG